MPDTIAIPVSGNLAAPQRVWRRKAHRVLSAAAGIFLFSGAGFAAQGLPAEPRVTIKPRSSLHARSAFTRSNLRVDVNMTIVPVTVTDLWDKPVLDLPMESFRVYEDNVEQKIVHLSKEDGPVSVGFIFDTSGSMKKRMDRSIAAIQQFLKGATPEDEFFLVQFSDRPVLTKRFTRDPDEILAELSSAMPQGWTAMLDAICLGVHEMKHAKNSRRALFVLTDGGDNNSRYTEAEVKNLVMESDVRIYAIGLFERPHFLEKIAMETGGRAFVAHKLDDLPETVDRLSNELRNQYVLAYSSNSRQGNGKYRKLRVELIPAAKQRLLNVFWRRGYYSPVE
jgi:VWFA-related protein